MKAIDVENIRFEFDDEWTVVEKWDDSRVYQDGIRKLQGTKAVDIVGVHKAVLYLVEVKDLRGHPEAKQEEVLGRAAEIALKVRDTVAGVAGAARLAKESWAETCARLLIHPARGVTVVAWIEEGAPRHAEPRGKRDVRRDTLRAQLEQHLAWLTRKVSVASPFDTRVPGVVVRNLPGAGQH